MPPHCDPAGTDVGVEPIGHCVRLLGAAGVEKEEAYGLVRAVVAQVIGEAVTSHGAFSRVGIDLIMEGLESRLGPA